MISQIATHPFDLLVGMGAFVFRSVVIMDEDRIERCDANSGLM